MLFIYRVIKKINNDRVVNAFSLEFGKVSIYYC